MLVFNKKLLFVILISNVLSAEQIYKLATPITKVDYAKWDISIFADGKNLPLGQGNYEDGKKIFVNKCASCHGEAGKGGIRLDPYRKPIATLVKSKGDRLTGEHPKKNIGTYWQHASLLFDYIRRTMPYQDPKSLTTNEIYSLSAYLLAENGIIKKETIISQKNLATLKMPNANGFICDNHVDTKSLACMHGCLIPKDKSFNKDVKIDMHDYLQSDCLKELH